MKGLEIKYTIDNFSGLVDISNADNEDWPKSKKIGVYFFYSKDRELLYIGKSVCCIRNRFSNHLFTETPNGYNEKSNDLILERRKSYYYFAYTIVEKGYVDMIERFLIQKHKPIFNTEFNYH
tara:strand:+ start:176 stop:541 length:366 start_codon:yes stop_codon:yes gene_type:complete